LSKTNCNWFGFEGDKIILMAISRSVVFASRAYLNFSFAVVRWLRLTASENGMKAVWVVVKLLSSGIGHDPTTPPALLTEFAASAGLAEVYRREAAVVGERRVVEPDIPQVSLSKVALNQ
jgi:hypothetical protein